MGKCNSKHSTRIQDHRIEQIPPLHPYVSGITKVWCAPDINKTEDVLRTQMELRKVVNYVKVFDDVCICEQWVQKRRNFMEKIIFIMSAKCGREILQRMNNSKNVVFIYIYDVLQDSIAMWLNDYEKVRCALSDSQELLATVSADQKRLQKIEKLTAMPMSIFTLSPPPSSSSSAAAAENSSTDLNGDFLWLQLFTEVLLRMKHTKLDRQELIDLCKASQKGNTHQLRIIDEFERSYSEENAVWWYTRESCFYSMLNKALRTQDIDTLIAFRFFITDLYYQLRKLRGEENDVIRAYRGQLMAIEELDRLKSSVNQYVSMNSFLSTTIDLSVATFFLPSSSNEMTDGMQAVLFEIETDPLLRDVKPYADISPKSYFRTEKEVLFMLGSIFKIQSVTAGNIFYTVKLSLCNQKDHELRELTNYLKNKLPDEPNFYILGDLLDDMSEYDKAEKCFQRGLNRLNDHNSKEAGDCYTGLGNAAFNRGNYDLAIFYHNKALKNYMIYPQDDAKMSACYTNLGNAHEEKKDHENALEYYNKSLLIREKVYGTESTEAASVIYNIGIVFENQEEYNDALAYYKRSLEIYEKTLPSDHYYIARAFASMSETYYYLKQYPTALEHLEKSLALFKKSVTQMHDDLAVLYHFFGRVHEDMDRLELALHYYDKADTTWFILIRDTFLSCRRLLREIVLSIYC